MLTRDVGRGEDFFRGAVIEALGDYKAGYAYDALTAVARLEGPLQDDAALAPGLPPGIAGVFLDEIVVVSEDDVAAAMAGLALHDRVVAEGAGAVAVAALARVRGARRVAIVSGGNVDASVLGRVLARDR